MQDWPERERYTAEDLLQIIRILRDRENGCPWDKVQTHASIRKNFLEETCEALEAIDADDAAMMREELGDVLMQVAFHTVMEEERGRFDFEQVCREVCEKLVFRHPNIFASSAARNAGINSWDALKNKEKGRRTLADELDTVPATLPALMRAAKLQKRAARCGVETAAAPADIIAAAETAVSAADKAVAEQAVGELLFTAAALARQAGVDPEQALQKRNAHDVQEGILIPQGIIVTVLALLFVLIPNGNTAFATLVDMATALYLVMYMLMFAAAIRLRNTHPEVRRTYRVPAIRLVAGVGFVASAAAFVLTFVRPAGFTGLDSVSYAILVAVVVLVLGLPPLVLYGMRKPGWDLRSDAERNTDTYDVLVNPEY